MQLLRTFELTTALKKKKIKNMLKNQLCHHRNKIHLKVYIYTHTHTYYCTISQDFTIVMYFWSNNCSL